MAVKTFEFRGEQDSIYFKLSSPKAPYRIEITDGDYEAHYSISQDKKEAFNLALKEAIFAHAKTEFVWFSSDFFE